MNRGRNKFEHYAQWNGQSLEQVLKQTPPKREPLIPQGKRNDQRIIGRPIDANLRRTNMNYPHEDMLFQQQLANSNQRYPFPTLNNQFNMQESNNNFFDFEIPIRNQNINQRGIQQQEEQKINQSNGSSWFINLEDEVEDEMLSDFRFRGNLNPFITNTRTQVIRHQANQNRLQPQQAQNNRGERQRQQTTIRQSQQTNSNNYINRQLYNNNYLPQIRRGMQNVRQRLDQFDFILDQIEDFQDETEELIRNLAQIDRLIIREQQQKKKKKGISQVALNQQKLTKYVKTRGQDTCSICLKNLLKGDDIYKLTCNHVFHVDCIKPWFKQSHVCPNCRKDLNKISPSIIGNEWQ